MTTPRAQDPPRLIVTVLTESEAQPAAIATLIERQRASDTLILYDADLPDDISSSLRDVAETGPLSSGGQRSLLEATNYWLALDKHLTEATGPVLVARAGTWLPDCCWGRFSDVEDPEVRRIFPLSVRGEGTSIFLRPDHEPGLAPVQLDHWLNRYSQRLLFDLPYAEGFTAFLPQPFRTALRENSCSDAVFVDDRECSPRPLPQELPAAYVSAFRERHPLTGLRHAMSELSQRSEHPPAELPQCGPVNLHLSHGWGGGLWRWIEDFCAADGNATNLILKPIGDRSAYAQTMELVDARQPHVPLLRRTFATPILSTAVSHSEYRALLTDICTRFSVSALYVSSLIGQSMDLLRTSIPTLLVLHNFFPVCPAIIATFDGPCTSCDDERMADCFTRNPRQQFFLSENQEHWRAVRGVFREAVKRGHVQLVAPSDSVAQRFSSLFGGDQTPAVQIIPHGLPAADVPSLEALREFDVEDAGSLRIIVLGGQEAHKGGDLAAALVERLADVADFYLLGFGDDLADLARHPNVRTLDSYTRSDFHQILSEYRAQVGMLLSTVPETFSYTLSELNGAGVPTLATNLGAFADRIEHGLNGWLSEPDASAIEAQVRYLAEHRQEVADARARLIASPIRSATAMVEDYERVLPTVALAARGRPHFAEGPAFEGTAQLLVKEDVRYADALREFLAYSASKLLNSPRLGERQRRLLRKVFGR